MATSRKLLLSAVAASSSASCNRPSAAIRTGACSLRRATVASALASSASRSSAAWLTLSRLAVLATSTMLFQRRRRRQGAKGVERRQARGLVGLERAQRDVQQHACGLVAHGFVGVGTQNLRQRPDRAELAHRRLAHARVVVGACHLGQHVLLIFRKLVNTSESDLGVGVLPLRLRLESVENAHGSGGRDWLQSPLSGVETG